MRFVDRFLRKDKPMTLEDKYLAFCNGFEEAAFKQLHPEDTKTQGIRLHKTAIGSVFAEAHAAMSSARVAKNAHAFMGTHSYMNSEGYARGHLFVGRYCSIGKRVSLGAARHALNSLSTSPAIRGVKTPGYTPEEERLLFGAPLRSKSTMTVIENDVWIGDGAVLLLGVRIGTGSIVAANAVVTHDVEPYQIVGGVPARPIKPRFSEDVATRLLASKWWNLPSAFLNTLPAGHVLRTLDALESADQPVADLPTFMPVDAPAGTGAGSLRAGPSTGKSPGSSS